MGLGGMPAGGPNGSGGVSGGVSGFDKEGMMQQYTSLTQKIKI